MYKNGFSGYRTIVFLAIKNDYGHSTAVTLRIGPPYYSIRFNDLFIRSRTIISFR